MLDISLIRVGSQVSPITRRHKLAGTLTVDGQPASRLVTVFDRRDFSWVATTMSKESDGTWSITGLPEYPVNTLLIVALDSAGLYNAEVADYISQVATV